MDKQRTVGFHWDQLYNYKLMEQPTLNKTAFAQEFSFTFAQGLSYLIVLAFIECMTEKTSRKSLFILIYGDLEFFEKDW